MSAFPLASVAAAAGRAADRGSHAAEIADLARISDAASNS